MQVEDDVTAVLEYANGASGVFVTTTGASHLACIQSLNTVTLMQFASWLSATLDYRLYYMLSFQAKHLEPIGSRLSGPRVDWSLKPRHKSSPTPETQAEALEALWCSRRTRSTLTQDCEAKVQSARYMLRFQNASCVWKPQFLDVAFVDY